MPIQSEQKHKNLEPTVLRCRNGEKPQQYNRKNVLIKEIRDFMVVKYNRSETIAHAHTHTYHTIR